MSIDISVLFWTILSFLVLMLILNKLLFCPILDILEKRRKTVEAGRSAEKQAESVLEEQKKLLADRLDTCRREETEQAKQEAEHVDLALERALDEGDQDQSARRQAEKKQIEADCAVLTEAMEANIGKYTQKLCAKLTAGLQGMEDDK